MAKWICLFNDEWLTEFKAWLEKGSNSKCCNKPRYRKKTGIKKILESLFQYRFTPQIVLSCQTL